MELMMELATFHVTDVQTLDAILDKSVAYPSRPTTSIPFGLKESFLPCITKLNITLRLPLAFFKAFDESKDLGKRIPTPVLEEDLNIWTTLPSRLAKLKALQSLCIWLDHTHDRYWSIVNERAFLSHFEPLAGNPDLDVCFDLPKLHPTLEGPQRHYVGDDNALDESFASLLPLKIRRILRQRYHSELNNLGRYERYYVQDFPHCLGHPLYRNTPLAFMERWERGMWRDGKDVEHQLSIPIIEQTGA